MSVKGKLPTDQNEVTRMYESGRMRHDKVVENWNKAIQRDKTFVTRYKQLATDKALADTLWATYLKNINEAKAQAMAKGRADAAAKVKAAADASAARAAKAAADAAAAKKAEAEAKANKAEAKAIDAKAMRARAGELQKLRWGCKWRHTRWGQRSTQRLQPPPSHSPSSLSPPPLPARSPESSRIRASI
jgi:membrane protein involved in colicin uptake